jgi:excisionase family DNA binding protein
MGKALLLTPQQVAERLQVQVQTVVRWLRSGQLRGTKFGRLWRVTEPDLHAFIQQHLRTAPQEIHGTGD